MSLLRSHVRQFLLASFCVALFTPAFGASAQIYKLHNADIAIGATGPFTTVLTSNGSAVQRTTDSTGLIVSLREHPVAWAGIELNYGYNRFSEVYSNSSIRTFHAQTNVHEATAAYMFHPHFLHLQPFLNIGGGALDFVPSNPNVMNQWRSAGLVELGFDVPVGPHAGFRLQGRSLIYRTPSFGTPAFQTHSWVATNEPSMSAYIRF